MDYSTVLCRICTAERRTFVRFTEILYHTANRLSSIFCPYLSSFFAFFIIFEMLLKILRVSAIMKA